MELTKSELAKILKISEDLLTLNNGLWNVDFGLYKNRWIYINHKLVKDGKLIVKFGTVNGSFDCSNLNLVSLEGSPHTVNQDFYCERNNLSSLKYCPTFVGGNFWCYNNKLISLNYYPKNINMFLTKKNNYRPLIQNLKLKYYFNNNKITHIPDSIDVSIINLYKNPYHYFKKYNYGI